MTFRMSSGGYKRKIRYKEVPCPCCSTNFGMYNACRVCMSGTCIASKGIPHKEYLVKPNN